MVVTPKLSIVVDIWRNFLYILLEQAIYRSRRVALSHPSECRWQRTLNSIQRHTAARLQSNGNLTVWMSHMSKEWRVCSTMTLSTIHWVPVQDKWSKILCGKLGALKIISSDCLHQEYLTINLASTSDWQQLKLPLLRLLRDGGADACQQTQPWAENTGGGTVCCHLTFQIMLQPVRMACPYNLVQPLRVGGAIIDINLLA